MERSGEYVICPHCGNRHGDCREWVRSELPEKMKCSECGETFAYLAEYDVQYVTAKIKV